jgi:UDPglucose--hexose-1-phosphate uridylyltransferase
MPGELRQNPLTGRWVAVAPGRTDRPLHGSGRQREPRPPHSPDCPFCPGNERELEVILQERPDPSRDGWAIRVVTNRYPAFEWNGASARPPGVGKTLALGSDVPLMIAAPMPATGQQEVIIETPAHDRDLPDLSEAELRAVVETYHDRFKTLSEQSCAARVFLFRNRGADAGNSMLHAHAQVIATTTIPPEARVREIRMMGYHGDHGRCLLCALPEIEAAFDERLVAQDDHFTAVVPWAAESAFELWLIPRRHQAEFGECEPDELTSLARMLGDLLRRYRDRAGDPAYNLLVHSAPRGRAGSRAHHWFIQLRPRIHRTAGFELASGVHINPSLPESDARALRGEG